jgi:hypothetical protein
MFLNKVELDYTVESIAARYALVTPGKTTTEILCEKHMAERLDHVLESKRVGKDDFATCKYCPLTWEELYAFIRAEKLDEEEYFSNKDYENGWDSFKHEEVYTCNDTRRVRWIATWWTPGGSEGYYVHVEEIGTKGHEDYQKTRLLGKFWSIDSAEQAVNKISRFIHSKLY